MAHERTTIVWFRRDLRLSDNPALRGAIERGGPVIPVFIWAPEEEAPWEPGGAARWWLHHALASLGRDLERAGSKLLIRRGPTAETLRGLVAETGATGVFWNRLYEPAVIRRDTGIKAELKERGLDAQSFNGALLNEPTAILTQMGEPYKVFTPYWRTCLKQGEPAAPTGGAGRPAAPESWPESAQLASLGLLPKRDWADGFADHWTPGEDGAQGNLGAFVQHAVADYPGDRNIPSVRGTSRLSPHLHWGEISPRQVWHAAKNAADRDGTKKTAKGADKFLAEIGWREFAHHLLYHFPRTTDKPLRENFNEFPWSRDRDALRAWQRGRTGYPIVDAGMRELWATGWMHNRVRMIVASFLVKHLLVSWVEGARWFWDTLVDADLASNTLGWQWAGGCGADAAPYFRIFNPMTQGEKFDAKGEYTRAWVPELAKLPAKKLFAPWEMPPAELEHAGVRLGRDYPEPVVVHKEARQRALDAFATIKGK